MSRWADFAEDLLKTWKDQRPETNLREIEELLYRLRCGASRRRNYSSTRRRLRDLRHRLQMKVLHAR